MRKKYGIPPLSASAVTRKALGWRKTKTTRGLGAEAARAECFEKLIKSRGYPMPMVILLDVWGAVAKQRLQARGRADDKAGTIERRIADDHAETDAIVEHYGKLIHRLDATRTVQEVSRDIEAPLGAK
ncbi:MAG: hypothetical protein K2X35_02310 [Bryobacteraceae bacterium]|nr:hypothetical protein [Bryobacteraceae bacterium]